MPKGNSLLSALTGENVAEEVETKEGKKYDWRRAPFQIGDTWYHLAAIREPEITYYVVAMSRTANGQSGHVELLSRSDGSVLVLDKPSEFSGSADSLESILAKAARMGKTPSARTPAAQRS